MSSLGVVAHRTTFGHGQVAVDEDRGGGEGGVQRSVDVTDRLRGQRPTLGTARTFEVVVEAIAMFGGEVLEAQPADVTDDPKLDLLLVVGARRLTDDGPSTQPPR